MYKAKFLHLELFVFCKTCYLISFKNISHFIFEFLPTFDKQLTIFRNYNAIYYFLELKAIFSNCILTNSNLIFSSKF